MQELLYEETVQCTNIKSEKIKYNHTECPICPQGIYGVKREWGENPLR